MLPNVKWLKIGVLEVEKTTILLALPSKLEPTCGQLSVAHRTPKEVGTTTLRYLRNEGRWLRAHNHVSNLLPQDLSKFALE